MSFKSNHLLFTSRTGSKRNKNELLIMSVAHQPQEIHLPDIAPLSTAAIAPPPLQGGLRGGSAASAVAPTSITAIIKTPNQTIPLHIPFSFGAMPPSTPHLSQGGQHQQQVNVVPPPFNHPNTGVVGAMPQINTSAGPLPQINQQVIMQR